MFSSTTSSTDRPSALDELSALDVNGTKQWLLYRSKSLESPVVLFVHGGPGSPLMYFSRAFDDVYLEHFTVVHWDQRGSGKSYDPPAPIENCNFQQIVSDGLIVTEYLKARFGKEKILLVGHSWGTMVASNMVKERPDEFSAYVSVGTVADMLQGEKFRFELLRKRIEESGNHDGINQLEAVNPPHHNFEELVAFGELLIRFLGFSGTFHNLTMDQVNQAVLMNKEYSEAEMSAAIENMRALWNQLAGFVNTYVAAKSVPRLDVPTYFVQGKYDLNTPTHLALAYFHALKTNKPKEWSEFPNSAHFPFYEEPDAFLNVLRRAAEN
jgi:pimeloyl-ACP methyl ester carboxylesterase